MCPRSEDHRGRSDPVGEEDGGRDGTDGVCAGRLRPRRPPALHGEPAAEVHPLAGPHQRHTGGQLQQRHRPQRLTRLQPHLQLCGIYREYR